MPFTVVFRKGRGNYAKVSSAKNLEALKDLKLDKELTFLKEICKRLNEHSNKQIEADIAGIMTEEEYDDLVKETASQYSSKIDCNIEKEFHPTTQAAVDIALEVLDGSDKSLGGIHGVVEENKLFIETLWLSEKARGKNLGETLVSRLEELSVSQYSCTESRAASTSYQAVWLFDRLKYQRKYGFSVPYKLVETHVPLENRGKIKLDIDVNVKSHKYCYFEKKLTARQK